MSRGSIVCGAVFLTALLNTSVKAQQMPRQKMDVSKLGPHLGEQVPDFSLRDQNGNTRTRDSIMGSKGAMLVFFRSADW